MLGRGKAENAFNLGITLLKRGCVEDAAACFEQAIRQDPLFTKALQQRSFVLCMMGEPVRALEDCQLAIAIDKTDAWSYLHRAIVQSKLQNFRSTIDDCSTALKLDPGLLVAYTERGAAYCELREFQAAIADFTKGIKLNPLDSVNYVCRAVAYDEIGKHRQTIKDFSRAIELNLMEPIGYFSRGLAYHKIDNFAKALKDYDKALELQPEFDEVRQNRQIALDQLEHKHNNSKRNGTKSKSTAPASADRAVNRTAQTAADLAPTAKRAKVYDIFTKIEIATD